MKKVSKSRPEPEILSNFREENPKASWKRKKETKREGSFKGDAGKGQREVYTQILANQRGLCAYCEINLTPDGVGKNDFRVEHFHPEGVVDDHNYSLDWDNLLGVCHGGSEKDVADKQQRYTHIPDNRRCDVPKGSKNWVGEILNPLIDIPVSPPLFRFVPLGDGSMDDDAGKIEVDDINYPPDLYPDLYEKAQKSISRLRLNAPQLRELRLAIMTQLREQLFILQQSGDSEDQAYEELAEQELTLSNDGHWNPFFTCIRWILADKAEDYLQKNNYNG